MARAHWAVSEFTTRIRAGERAALGRAITLVESTRPADRALARALLTALGPPAALSTRVGLTGAPGVGKSTLLESLGRHLIEAHGRRVAVLAVDPSSPRSGGSILGDKTRMPWLSTHPAAFVRPSPAGTALGGVARRTREAIALCEAAGFDTVLVETVGVGQSEVAVRQLTDCFLLLLLAGAGDELQGIKRGVMELADVLAVTKADGANAPRARVAARQARAALHLLRPSASGWAPPVLTCSALPGSPESGGGGSSSSVVALWAAVEQFLAHQRATGTLQAQRQQQALGALREELRTELESRFFAQPAVAAALPALEAAVASGTLTPTAAAAHLLAGT